MTNVNELIDAIINSYGFIESEINGTTLNLTLPFICGDLEF